MKYLLLTAALLSAPIAARAQAVTSQDETNASTATAGDLLTLVTKLRAQIIADQREIADLKKQVPTPAPSAPSAAKEPPK